LKTTVESFKSPGTTEVEINPLGTVGALLDRMAAALGLPAAALALRLPDKSTVNPKSKVASFFKAWGE
jgi:hypothetical protein